MLEMNVNSNLQINYKFIFIIMTILNTNNF